MPRRDLRLPLRCPRRATCDPRPATRDLRRAGPSEVRCWWRARQPLAITKASTALLRRPSDVGFRISAAKGRLCLGAAADLASCSAKTETPPDPWSSTVSSGRNEVISKSACHAARPAQGRGMLPRMSIRLECAPSCARREPPPLGACRQLPRPERALVVRITELTIQRVREEARHAAHIWLRALLEETFGRAPGVGRHVHGGPTR